MIKKLLTALEVADLEGRKIRKQVEHLELPENPSAWLDWHAKYASSLSDELPQKEYILRYIQIAHGELSKGNDIELRVWMYKIQCNCEEAAHAKWVAGVENQYAEITRKRNKEQQPINEARWKEWRDEAARVAKELPSIANKKSRLAVHVKKNLNRSETVQAIRKRI